MIESRYGFPTSSASGRHPIPRDRATALSPTHTATLEIPGERTGVAAKFGERGVLKVGLSEAANNTIHYILAQQ